MTMIRSSRLILFCILVGAWCITGASAEGDHTAEAALDPRGEAHIPIGIANTLDSLKTFVEAEGCFSPGVGTYGIYFWVYDEDSRRLFAPTMEDVPCEHGLTKEGYLIPWAKWQAGDFRVRTEVCHVRLDYREERMWSQRGLHCTIRRASDDRHCCMPRYDPSVRRDAT